MRGIEADALSASYAEGVRDGRKAYEAERDDLRRKLADASLANAARRKALETASDAHSMVCRRMTGGECDCWQAKRSAALAALDAKLGGKP